MGTSSTYNRMKAWIKHRIRRFEPVSGAIQETEKLREQLEFAKSDLDKKNEIIMEQLKVKMHFYSLSIKIEIPRSRHKNWIDS